MLLVEDNPVNLMVAKRLIQISSFDCMNAENGEIALDMLQQRALDRAHTRRPVHLGLGTNGTPTQL